jgi:hypothetical protein
VPQLKKQRDEAKGTHAFVYFLGPSKCYELFFCPKEAHAGKGRAGGWGEVLRKVAEGGLGTDSLCWQRRDAEGTKEQAKMWKVHGANFEAAVKEAKDALGSGMEARLEVWTIAQLRKECELVLEIRIEPMEDEEDTREEKRRMIRMLVDVGDHREEQARKEAEEQAKKEAEEHEKPREKERKKQARKQTKSQARKEAEEQQRLKAEKEARKEAEEQARKEAEEQAKKA